LGFLLWGIGEGLGGHVFGDELGGEAADGVGVEDDGLGIVLGLVAAAAGLAGDDKDAFAGSRPVGGAFAGDLAVGYKTLRMADLAGGGFADDKMRIVGVGVLSNIGVEQRRLCLVAGLAFVEGDQHRDARVQGFGENDVVEFLVVIAVHIEIEGDGDAGEHVFQDIVDVVAADVEEMEHGAGAAVVGFLFGVLGELVDLEGGEALAGAEGVAGGLRGRGGLGVRGELRLGGGLRGGGCAGLGFGGGL